MKKFISLLLVLLLTFSLCSCGSVEIGPLTFNFDSLPNNTDGDNAVMAPPVETMAPAGNVFAFEDFSFTPWGSFMGDFTPRGYHASYDGEGLGLYLFLVFDYTEYAGNYGANGETAYVTEVVIDNISYPVLDLNAHKNHFINNIDRYFCYDYAAPGSPLNAGQTSTMIACFEIPEEARIAVHSGTNPIYCVRDTYIECEGNSDIMFIEETLNVAPIDRGSEMALSQAQLLWSLDMSYYLLNYMMLSAEVYGGTGTFDPFCTDTMFKMYANGFAFSPATTPDFAGFFTIDSIGMQGMVPEIALETYGDEVWNLFFEYRELCLMLADMAMTSGMEEEFFSQCEYAISRYYELVACIGAEPYEFVIDEV